jgi:hypothetical protein
LTCAPQVCKTAPTLATNAVIKEQVIVMLFATEVIGIEEEFLFDGIVIPRAESAADDDDDDDDWDLDADEDVDELEELGDLDDWGSNRDDNNESSDW